MNFSISLKIKDIWHKWFAWYPVEINRETRNNKLVSEWVCGKTILRKITWGNTQYKLLEDI